MDPKTNLTVRFTGLASASTGPVSPTAAGVEAMGADRTSLR